QHRYPLRLRKSRLGRFRGRRAMIFGLGHRPARLGRPSACLLLTLWETTNEIGDCVVNPVHRANEIGTRADTIPTWDRRAARARFGVGVVLLGDAASVHDAAR